ncbi:MAG TPA: nitroreductase family protein [Caldilineaceae bacterium]|nr:nitroreductase family protein [Caldilineaceae bacterium]
MIRHAVPAAVSPTDIEATDIEATEAQAQWPALWQVIRARRSVRRYQSRPIERAVLERLLEAASWAPSAHNRQPWRFCVTDRAETKEALSAAMAARWRADLSADGVDPLEIERRVTVSHARLTGAAALVVASLSMEEMDSYPDAVRAQAEWTMAVQSVALACQNLLLAAHAHGLGACWMCAPLFVGDLVREALALPAHWQPQALITLGYPAETRTKDRAPLASRVVWR